MVTIIKIYVEHRWWHDILLDVLASHWPTGKCHNPCCKDSTRVRRWAFHSLFFIWFLYNYAGHSEVFNKNTEKNFFLPTKFPSYINLQMARSNTFSRFLVDAMFLIVLLVYVIMLVLYLHQVCLMIFLALSAYMSCIPPVCSAAMERFEPVSLSKLW